MYTRTQLNNAIINLSRDQAEALYSVFDNIVKILRDKAIYDPAQSVANHPLYQHLKGCLVSINTTNYNSDLARVELMVRFGNACTAIHQFASQTDVSVYIKSAINTELLTLSTILNCNVTNSAVQQQLSSIFDELQTSSSQCVRKRDKLAAKANKIFGIFASSSSSSTAETYTTGNATTHDPVADYETALSFAAKEARELDDIKHAVASFGGKNLNELVAIFTKIQNLFHNVNAHNTFVCMVTDTLNKIKDSNNYATDHSKALLMSELCEVGEISFGQLFASGVDNATWGALMDRLTNTLGVEPIQSTSKALLEVAKLYEVITPVSFATQSVFPDSEDTHEKKSQSKQF